MTDENTRSDKGTMPVGKHRGARIDWTVNHDRPEVTRLLKDKSLDVELRIRLENELQRQGGRK